MGGRGSGGRTGQWFRWNKHNWPEGNKPLDKSSSSSENKNSYTSFSDTASGGWTYYGDGKEQVEFFNQYSNYDELINNMNSNERSAFQDYWTPGHFMDGQQYRGWDNMSSRDQRLTKMYDNILDKSTLDKGVVLVRRTDAQLVMGAGNRRATLEQLKSMEGRTVTSKGSMSFGAASQGLTIGDSSKNIEYKLHIPGGTKGAGMWIGDRRINGWGPEQREFMTNRDIALKVGKTVYDKSRGVYVVDVYWLGRLKHDYGSKGK